MKALRFDCVGDLDALRLTDEAPPEAGSGEVRVRVVAGGLNPSDVKNVLGRFAYTTLPRIPGRDFAGVVDEGPADRLGEEVWGTGNELGFTRDGSHAEFLTLPADGVATRPRRLSFAQCAACGVPYTTALDALDRAGANRGARVLIVGMGAVGKAALDIARWQGAFVAGAARRPEQLAYLRDRGVPDIALGAPEALAEAVAEHFAEGADVVFDTTGAWLEPSVAALAHFGRIAVIAAPPDGYARLPVVALYRKGGSVVGINSLLHDSRACAAMLSRLAVAFDAGQLPAPAAPAEVPLTRAVEVYREASEGRRSDKVVFTASGARA